MESSNPKPPLNLMEKEPLSGIHSEEITVFIQISRDECNELFSFLNSNGVRAVKSFGITNSIMPDVDPKKLADAFEKGTPYLMVYGVARLLAASLNAYIRRSSNRELRIKKTKEGVELVAKNISVDEINKLEALDLILIPPIPTESQSPPTTEYKQTGIGFKTITESEQKKN